MTKTERETLIRRYAAADISWSTLRARGSDNDPGVLAALGALGLRPRIAPARERGRAAIRAALQSTR